MINNKFKSNKVKRIQRIRTKEYIDKRIKIIKTIKRIKITQKNQNYTKEYKIIESKYQKINTKK